MFFSCVFLLAIGWVPVIQAGVSIGCTEGGKICPDMFTFVSRDPNNNCEFKPCPACVVRQLDFSHRDYFAFSINNNRRVKEHKALEGSGKRYKRRGDVNIDLKYVFLPTSMTDKRGFNGKICFKVKGAKSKEIERVGIPVVTCNPAPPHCTRLAGALAIDPKAVILPINKFTKHCIHANDNSRLSVRLESAGGKIKVEAYYFKGCEVKA